MKFEKRFFPFCFSLFNKVYLFVFSDITNAERKFNWDFLTEIYWLEFMETLFNLIALNHIAEWGPVGGREGGGGAEAAPTGLRPHEIIDRFVHFDEIAFHSEW